MNSLRKLLAFLGVLVVGLSQPERAGAASIEEEKAVTIAMMRKVWDALAAFKRDNGQYPGELSDLVPRYLPDADELISPTEKRTGRHGDNGQVDPKFRTSFCYEFTTRRFNKSKDSFRAIKERQMEEFGGVVPLLRCFLFDRVINLSVSGDIFESPLYWETSPGAQEVMARIGPGPGFKDGEFAKLTVTDGATGRPVAGAEVRLTGRQYHGLPLPDRTLHTGDDGTVPVPLAVPNSSRKLVVTVLKPGFYASSQLWTDKNLPKEAAITLDDGEVLGGIVRTTDGRPVKGAEVTVLHMQPDAKKEGKFIETPLTREITDAEGRWTCTRVPKNFIGIALEVKHASAWTSWFYSSRAPGPHRVLRSALLEKSAELSLEPAAIVRGTVSDAQGRPVAGAEVMVKASFPHPPHARAEGGVATKTPPDPAPVKTNATGHYVISWCDEAELTIMAFPADAPPARLSVTADAGMKEQDLKLENGRTVRGKITDENGKALAGAEIFLLSWKGVALPAIRPSRKPATTGSFPGPMHRRSTCTSPSPAMASTNCTITSAPPRMAKPGPHSDCAGATRRQFFPAKNPRPPG